MYKNLTVSLDSSEEIATFIITIKNLTNDANKIKNIFISQNNVLFTENDNLFIKFYLIYFVFKYTLNHRLKISTKQEMENSLLLKDDFTFGDLTGKLLKYMVISETS